VDERAGKPNYRGAPRRRRRRRRARRGISLPGLLLLVALASVVVYSLRAVALDDVTGWLGAVYEELTGGEERARDVVLIDITAMNVDADDMRRVYRFYYYDPDMMDLDRHQVIDDEGFVRLITYNYGVMTIHTYAPAIFDIHHNLQADVVLITVHSPRIRYERIVIIDPGHGGEDTGTTHGGVYESEVNLVISLMVYELFLQSGSGVKAFLTRFEDEHVSMIDRTTMGNMIGDLFVSVHNNAYTGSSGVSGTEVIFAQNSAMDAIGNQGRANISNAAFSQIMQNHLVEALGTRNRGIVNRTDLAVPNTSAIPLAFLEIEFLTNPQARANLQDPEFLARAAQAIYDGVLAAFEAGGM